MRLLFALVLGALLPACEDAFVCKGACDGGVAAVDSGSASPGRAVVVLAPVILTTRPLYNGTVVATLELASPASVDAPAGLTGGDFLHGVESDVLVALTLHDTGARLGGSALGELVPYLRSTVTLTNEDNGQALTLSLLPMLSLDEGIRYVRNVALKKTLGAAQSSYSVKVMVSRPAWAGEASAELFSSGVVRDADVVGLETGTCLGELPAEVHGHFSLDDLLAPRAAAAATSPAGGTSSSGPSGYISP